MTSVTTSIVYTDPLQRNPTSSALQPFFISVSFLGSLPPHILTGEIVHWFTFFQASRLLIYFPSLFKFRLRPQASETWKICQR
jgi:hypothetical protein